MNLHYLLTSLLAYFAVSFVHTFNLLTYYCCSDYAEKLYTDSAFYNDPDHKYPTVEEQIALARRVAQSVLAPANVNSRGHKMFVKRRERSVHWEAGYKPPEGAAGETDQDVPNALRPEPLSTVKLIRPV